MILHFCDYSEGGLGFDTCFDIQRFMNVRE
jgi:hypothetical protein